MKITTPHPSETVGKMKTTTPPWSESIIKIETTTIPLSETVRKTETKVGGGIISMIIQPGRFPLWFGM